MQTDRVNAYLTANAGCFPEEQLAELRGRLLRLDDAKLEMLQSMPLRKPQNMLLIAVFFGFAGIDRLLLGDVVWFFLKLFTVGLCGVLWLVDIFSVKKRARSYNFRAITANLQTAEATDAKLAHLKDKPFDPSNVPEKLFGLWAWHVPGEDTKHISFGYEGKVRTDLFMKDEGYSINPFKDESLEGVYYVAEDSVYLEFPVKLVGHHKGEIIALKFSVDYSLGLQLPGNAAMVQFQRTG